jgi:hypothetical protein
MHSIHHFPSRVSKIPALLSLLSYATSHKHSEKWVGAITLLLSREGSRHA